MSEIIKTNAEYSKWIKEVSLRFRNSQIKAATKVNEVSTPMRGHNSYGGGI